MEIKIRPHCNIGHAIRALIPNYKELDPTASWSYNAITNDYDTLTWTSTKISKPTKTEIETKLAELNLENKKNVIRNKRNKLLAETDWMANSDVTMSDQWKTYRQALRDLPSTTDVDNPVYPTPPS
tara:strand:- start:620 stop:997 length:378 start_codon:yes stop_codon:yes gene_type:complete